MTKFRFLPALASLIFIHALANAQTASPAADLPPVALRALVLVATPDEVLPDGLDIAPGIHAPSLPALEDPAFIARLSTFLGQPLTIERLNEISRTIVGWYRDQGIPLVDVVLPEQDASNGVVQMIVVKSRVGRVTVEGGDWFAAQHLQSQIRLKPDQTIQSSILFEDLNWLNRNPFRSADIVYAPGAEFGTTDIIIRTTDRFPLMFSAGYDNSGNQYIGYDRYRAGATWGNAFGLDHIMRLGYITSGDTSQYSAYTFGYIAPLPWRHVVSFFASYQETSPTLNTFFRREGSYLDLSLRYSIPLASPSRYQNLRHEATIGVDFKRGDNDLIFGSFRANSTRTDIIQFVGSYHASLRDKLGGTSLTASVYLSPGGLTDDNKRAAFNRVRRDASAKYAYGSVALDRVTRLPLDLTWNLKLVAQFAQVNLLGSEQIGIGGMYTVRGYDERELNGDGGYLVVNELRSPSISVLDKLGWSAKGARDSLQGLVFVDYGQAIIHKPLVGQKKYNDIASAGVGFRYVIAPYLSVVADFGWQLKDSGARANGDSLNLDGYKGHISISLNY
jgi:hemolysin activation/secretion protein